jgi:hypothetical protein
MWRHGMPDYNAMDKTDWFIQKMRSGCFSRREIVELAATESPSISEKVLDSTIGQYWSDSVNPKWSTWKAIRARGLRVVEAEGRRRIVEDCEAFTSPAANDKISTPGVQTAERPSPERQNGLQMYNLINR